MTGSCVKKNGHGCSSKIMQFLVGNNDETCSHCTHQERQISIASIARFSLNNHALESKYLEIIWPNISRGNLWSFDFPAWIMWNVHFGRNISMFRPSVGCTSPGPGLSQVSPRDVPPVFVWWPAVAAVAAVAVEHHHFSEVNHLSFHSYVHLLEGNQYFRWSRLAW